MSEEYKPITNLWKDSEGYRYFGTLKLSSKIKYDGDDFIPLWEWVKQLQQENTKLRIEISAREEVCDRLEDNWNKLKEYLFDIRKRGFALQNLANVTKNTEPGIAILIIINKMQELERSDSNGQ